MSTSKESKLEIQRLLWVRRNRGVMAEIARQFNVSHQTVRNYVNGEVESMDEDIAAALAKAGAPGFAIDQPTAA